MNTRNITRYALIALLLLITIVLLWWFFILRSNTKNVESTDAARGLGTSGPQAPASGSTHENAIASGGSGGSFAPSPNLTNPGVTFTGSPGPGSNRAVNLPGVGDWTNSTSSAAFGTKFRTPRLWHIDAVPVAGFGFVRSATTTARVIFVERATGYLFSADAASGSLIRLSNTLVPKVYDARVAYDGAVILRTQDSQGQLITFSATSTKASLDATPQPLVGSNLDRGIQEIAAQPGTRNITFTEELEKGVSGYTSLWDGTKKKQVFSSAVGEWRLQYLSDGRIFIVQKAEDAVPGFAYIVETDGHFTPVVRSIPGLTIAPQPGSAAIIYGSSDGLVLSLFSRMRTDATSTPLPVHTTADKCVWGKNSIAYCAAPTSLPGKNYLRNWYLGNVHSEDGWWRIDASTGNGEQFFSAPAGAAGADVEDPVIDPTGNFIVFRDARDQSLWLFRITP